MSDMIRNYISVSLYLEDGCSYEEGEYSLKINDVIGDLDISSIGGVDDISLIKECIDEYFKIPDVDGEIVVDFVLKESGEWEDNSWHKYYEIESYEFYNF